MEQEDQFASYLANERQLGDRTIFAYLTFHRLFDPLKLSQEYINDFVIRHKNTSIVRTFIKHFLEHNGIPDAFSLPKRPIGRKPQRIIRSLTAEQLEHAKQHFRSISVRHGLLFDMLYEGAMRRVEVITITLGSFYWNEWFDNPSDFCKLVILGKGKKQRVVLISPETMQTILGIFVGSYNLETKESIKEFIANNKNNYLLTKDKKPLTEKIVYDMIKKNSIDALGRDIRPHELRHARATELEKRGVPIRDIKNYLGHSKIATTEIYLHKSGEESTETIKEALR